MTKIYCFASIWFFLFMFTIFKSWNHFLKIILIFEFMILFVLVFFLLFSFHSDSLFFFVGLTISACEASVGLGCLVYLMRSEGNDFFSSMSILSC